MTVPSNQPRPRAFQIKRVLAIDPTHRGFGFAVLESSNRLVDWGVVDVRDNGQPACLRRIDRLIEFHHPDLIVTENLDARGSRRGKRIKRLLGPVRDLTHRHRVELSLLSKAEIRKFFGVTISATKHDIAAAVVEMYQELRPIMPRRRKCYKSEDERIAVFGAIALGCAQAHSRA